MFIVLVQLYHGVREIEEIRQMAVEDNGTEGEFPNLLLNSPPTILGSGREISRG